MPKPVYDISPAIISELKKTVLKLASFPIRTKSDAGYLSLLMKRKGIDSISESTIFRFFNNSNDEHKFYLNTLDKFAVFCGKKDFNDFEKWAKNNQEFYFSFGQIYSPNKPIKSLIQICIHQNQLKPIHEFTEQLTDFKNLDMDLHLNLGFEFYKSLITNKNSNIKFFKEFSQNPLIRESFFERCIDPDFKIPGYEFALNKYLINVSPEDGLQQTQDYIFANCMLLRYNYIINNINEANKLASLLYDNYIFSKTTIEDLYIYPKMRYLSYKIFNFSLRKNKKAIIDCIYDLLFYCKKNIPIWSYDEQRIAFSCIADTFIHAGISQKYQELLKETFYNLLIGYSPGFALHSLKYILKYTDKNGIYTYKRLANM